MSQDEGLEADLIGRATAGDEAALAELFERYRGRLRQMVRLRLDSRLQGRVDPSDVIQLPSTVAQGDRQIPRELLAHIIHQRMDEIFDLVQRDIATAGYAGKLSAGVVLTGGAAAMQGVAELASDVFGTGVRVGLPAENIGGLSDSVEAPRFATAVGLAQYAAHRVALGAGGAGVRRLTASGGGVGKFAERVKFWLQDFF